MDKPKILYICGSLNQTTQMHQISKELPEYDAFFTPYYPDGYGYIKFVTKIGLLDFSILGGQAKERTIVYLRENELNLDLNGSSHDYDLVFTCRDLLIKKGVDPNKIEVTGIPNFDNCESFLDNDFPHLGYVLVATSDMRETYKYENRKKFIQNAFSIAAGRQMIFKLHPNENFDRAAEEINKFAPGSLIYHQEKIEPMIANCAVLITRFSTVAYVGLALGKVVYSDFDVDNLKELVPIQNSGTSAFHIAQIGRRLLAANEISGLFEVRGRRHKHIRLKEKFKLMRKL